MFVAFVAPVLVVFVGFVGFVGFVMVVGSVGLVPLVSLALVEGLELIAEATPSACSRFRCASSTNGTVSTTVFGSAEDAEPVESRSPSRNQRWSFSLCTNSNSLSVMGAIFEAGRGLVRARHRRRWCLICETTITNHHQPQSPITTTIPNNRQPPTATTIANNNHNHQSPTLRLNSCG